VQGGDRGALLLRFWNLPDAAQSREQEHLAGYTPSNRESSHDSSGSLRFIAGKSKVM
jgi:hypothetical protein